MYPTRSDFVGPMRGREPSRPEMTGDPRIDAVIEYLFQREMRRYLAANGVAAPTTQVSADFVSPWQRSAEDQALDNWRSTQNPQSVGYPSPIQLKTSWDR